MGRRWFEFARVEHEGERTGQPDNGKPPPGAHRERSGQGGKAVHFNFSESEMAHYRLIASSLNMSIDAPKRSRKRKQTLTRVIKQLAKAGVVGVARVEIGVDGTIAIITGKSEITTETAANPWDEVYTRGKH